MKQDIEKKKIVIASLIIFVVLAIAGVVFFLSKRADVARPSVVTVTDPTQRDVASIRAFAGKPDLAPEYAGAGTSSYDESIPTRIYNVGADQIEVDARNGKVIQFGMRSLPVGSEAGQGGIAVPDFQSGNAEASAWQFIYKNIPEVNFDTLTPHHGDKGSSRFFRWEDRSRNTSEGYPFVEVGFSQKGVLIEYVNAL